MGLDLIHVFCSERHHCQLICVLCEQLTSLDSLVIQQCNHVICEECARAAENPLKQCPGCSRDVGTLQCLRTAQPLAFSILEKVLVACPLRHENNCNCEWAGDYGLLPQHLKTVDHSSKATATMRRRGVDSKILNKINRNGDLNENAPSYKDVESRDGPRSPETASSRRMGSSPTCNKTKKVNNDLRRDGNRVVPINLGRQQSVDAQPRTSRRRRSSSEFNGNRRRSKVDGYNSSSRSPSPCAPSPSAVPLHGIGGSMKNVNESHRSSPPSVATSRGIPNLNQLSLDGKRLSISMDARSKISQRRSSMEENNGNRVRASSSSRSPSPPAVLPSNKPSADARSKIPQRKSSIEHNNGNQVRASSASPTAALSLNNPPTNLNHMEWHDNFPLLQQQN